MQISRFIAVFLMVFYLLGLVPGSAFAQDESASGLRPAIGNSFSSRVDEKVVQRIENLTRKILLKDIELERFNIDYRRHASVQGRWRGPRYYLSQGGNNASTMAGLFAAVAIREETRPSRVGLEESFVPQMLGQIIGGAGSATELAINKYHDQVAKKLKLDSKSAIARARKFRKDINALLRERSQLVEATRSQLTEEEVKLLLAEEKVLVDVCNLSFHEFVKFYVGVRRFRWFQDSLYVLDIFKNGVGVAGNIVAIDGLHQRKGVYAGHAGVLTFLSGLLIASNPVVSRGVGKVSSVVSKKQCKGLVESTIDEDSKKLDLDIAEFSKLVASSTGESFISKDLMELKEVHISQRALFRKKNDLALRESRQGTRSATENVLSGAIVGGTKMTLGICAMVAGYHHTYEPRKSNRLLETGSLVYGIGSAYGLADNTRIQLRNEYERYKNGKDHILPGQVLDEHLDAIEAVEARLLK